MRKHTVTALGPRGEPPELVCLEHDGCTWRRAVAPATRTGDPIALALLASHLREASTPLPAMMGHPKRARA